jgi:hypothetical protein
MSHKWNDRRYREYYTLSNANIVPLYISHFVQCVRISSSHQRKLTLYCLLFGENFLRGDSISLPPCLSAGGKHLFINKLLIKTDSDSPTEIITQASK